MNRVQSQVDPGKSPENRTDKKLRTLETDLAAIRESVLSHGKELRTHGKALDAIQTALTAIDIGKAEKAVTEFRTKMSTTGELAQWYILKSAVFSGLVTMAKPDGDEALLRVLSWYLDNDTVPAAVWGKHHNRTLESWYRVAMSGERLDRL